MLLKSSINLLQRLHKVASFSLTPAFSTEYFLLWQCGFFHVRIFLSKVNFGKAVCKKKICLFQSGSGLSDPKGDAAKINGRRSYRTGSKANIALAAAGDQWNASVTSLPPKECWKLLTEIAKRLNCYSEALWADGQWILGEKSFLSHHVHELIPLQQLKVTGLSQRKREQLWEQRYITQCSGQSKPHLNPYFFPSQSFLTHFQFTHLFPWEQKEDPSNCWHLIRAFLALEALEVRTFLISSTPPSTPEPSPPSFPIVLLQGTAGDKASPAPSGCTKPFLGWSTSLLGLQNGKKILFLFNCSSALTVKPIFQKWNGKVQTQLR